VRVCAGVAILGHFARIPFHFCSRLPNLKIPQLLAAGKLKGLSVFIFVSYRIVSYQKFIVRPLLREPRPWVHYKSQPNASKTPRKTQKSTYFAAAAAADKNVCGEKCSTDYQ